MKDAMKTQQMEDSTENVEVMVSTILTLMKESQKTSFFGTPFGNFILNVLASLSLTIGAFFLSFLYPDRQALRNALRDLWQQLARNKCFRMPFARAVDIQDNAIANFAIAHRFSDLELGLRHARIREREQWRNNVLYNICLQRCFIGPVGPGIAEPGNPLLSGGSGDIVAQFNFCVNDNVSAESVQFFMNNVLQGRRYDALEITSEPPNFILGSKLIRAHFKVRRVSGDDALDAQLAQALDLSGLAEEAIKLDENMTLQIGGLTVIHQDEQRRLIMSILSRMDVPIISSVMNFRGRALMIQGCSLSGCEFKASTSSRCTNLRVFKEVKLEDGLEVVFARVPEPNELLLDDQTYVYAYKSVLSEGKTIIVRSEGDLIKTSTSQQRSITDELHNSHTIVTIFLLAMIFNMPGMGFVYPTSSLIIRFSLQLIILVIGYCLVMLLLGPWFMKCLIGQHNNTIWGPLQLDKANEATTTMSGGDVEQSVMDAGPNDLVVAKKESGIPHEDAIETFKKDMVRPAREFDLLQSQPIDAKQSAHLAQREAERQANDFRMAGGAAVNNAKSFLLQIAEQKILQNEVSFRNEVLNDTKIALQKASDYEKKWEEAVATAQGALRDKEILQERLVEEVRKHQETQHELETQKRMVDAYASEADLANQQAQAEKDKCEEVLIKLEEVTRKLEEECQLRKEAEERASQEGIARQDAVVALRKEQQKYREYNFQELQSATNDFHEENKLGQGRYGPVYKGKLHHTAVAIKVLAREGSQGCVEFQKELEVLSSIRHPHMVILLGACPEKGCIVYEYMANGSLEDRLNCRDGTPPLPWYVRFKICLEVAAALLFLHSRPHPIVHRDLKPGNILLDHRFVSKISGVGLAKLVPYNVTFSDTMTVLVGTFPYMDPDYQRTGVVSCESDVYSLGIVMLQLLTGRQAVGLVDLVEDAVDNNQLEGVLDKSAGEWPLREAMALACLGLECAEFRRKNRPNLETKILPDLESIQSVPDIAAAGMARVGGPSSSGTMPMIPSSFYCPISQDIMEDPHFAADGFTYERDAIETWLQKHNTSPITNLMLSHKNLTPNHSIRSAIKEWYDNGLIERHVF